MPTTSYHGHSPLVQIPAVIPAGSDRSAQVDLCGSVVEGIRLPGTQNGDDLTLLSSYESDEYPELVCSPSGGVVVPTLYTVSTTAIPGYYVPIATSVTSGIKRIGLRVSAVSAVDRRYVLSCRGCCWYDQYQGLSLITPSGTVEADGSTIDVYHGSSATPGTILVVSASGNSGAVLDEVVTADHAGSFEFRYRRGTGAGAVTFRVHDVSSGVFLVATYDGFVLPTVRKLDFGRANKPAATGYLRADGTQYYGRDRTGLGWVNPSLPGTFEREFPADPKNSDGVFNRRNLTGLFRLDMPVGTYTVTVGVGDATESVTGQNVFCTAGTSSSPLSGINTVAGQFFEGSFQASTTADGVLEFGINGGGSYWKLTFIEISPAVVP